jgi:hypothetical protein
MTSPLRNVLFGSILALGALTLTGCLELEAELDVNSDATISGTINIEVASEAGALMGITSSESLAALVESGEAQDGLSAAAYSCTPAVGDTEKYEVDCTFSSTAFTDATEIWSASREGELITFRVFQEAAEGSGTDELIPGLELGGIDITATFPGDIESVTGDFAIQEDARTVEVTAPLSRSVDVTVVAQSGGGDVASVIGWIAVAVVGVAALAGVLFFWRRKGTSGDPAATNEESNSQPEELIIVEEVTKDDQV